MPIGQAKFGLLGGVVDPGKLELIETINASALSTVEFETLGSYNVHFITFNYEATSDTETQLRLSNNGGTSYIASGYQYAMQYGGTGGVTSEPKSTSATYIRLAGTTTANNRIQGYIYCYNLLDSSKYSFFTTHNFWYLNLATYYHLYQFGSGVLPTAETHNGIRILGTGSITGDFSIYGIAES